MLEQEVRRLRDNAVAISPSPSTNDMQALLLAGKAEQDLPVGGNGANGVLGGCDGDGSGSSIGGSCHGREFNGMVAPYMAVYWVVMYRMVVYRVELVIAYEHHVHHKHTFPQRRPSSLEQHIPIYIIPSSPSRHGHDPPKGTRTAAIKKQSP